MSNYVKKIIPEIENAIHRQSVNDMRENDDALIAAFRMFVLENMSQEEAYEMYQRYVLGREL